MRIIAGEWRGFPIAAPAGLNTRPTTDRVREALMSSLFYTLDGFHDVTVLDAFAGSGALGLEALSRGAEHAWFYEANQGSHGTLMANIEKLPGAQERSTVRKMDVFAHPPLGGHEPFGLVFLDPPYAYDPQQIFEFLDTLDQAGTLASYVTISYEHAKETDLSPFFDGTGWELITQKTFGETVIDIFGKED